MSGLLESMEGIMSSQVVDHFATKLGIDRAASKKGVTGVATSLMGGLAKKSNDSQAMGTLANMINESPDEPIDVNSMLSDERSPMHLRGQQMLDVAVSDRGGMVTQIARSLGIGSGAATGMLGTVATLVMGGFRKFGRGNNVTGASIGGLIREASGSLDATEKARAAIPTPASRPVEVARAHQPSSAAVVAHHRRAWWWAVLVPLILLGIWALARGRGPAHQQIHAPPAPEARRSPTMGTPRPLSFPEGTTEAAFFANVRASSGSDTPWFDLDRINFTTGSATLSEAAPGQISNIAEILKAYPKTRIRIHGSSDATGNPKADTQLSQQRAQSVQAALVAQGVDASRMEVAPEPGASPATPNRRAAIQVIER
jgi:outer membrane protein OmpA-like peptidoglycan-associated protein